MCGLVLFKKHSGTVALGSTSAMMRCKRAVADVWQRGHLFEKRTKRPQRFSRAQNEIHLLTGQCDRPGRAATICCSAKDSMNPQLENFE